MVNWRRGWSRVMEFLRGATGHDGYEAYCTHLAHAHPEQSLPSRADYFKVDQSERWNGIRRCC